MTAGGDYQPTIELKSDTALLADQATFGEEKVVERFEGVLALAPQFETEPQPPRNAGNCVFARIGADNPRRNDEIAATFKQRAPVISRCEISSEVANIAS